MSFALVPVKRLEDSKSRLLAHLPNAARRALTRAMLEDLLEALSQTRGLDRFAVTTPDPQVAQIARAFGAETLMREEPGLNAALEDGIERLQPTAHETCLIVLGDVAGALARDFETLLRASTSNDAPSIWLSPSADGGTSALALRPARAIPCCFGKDSAKRHREAALAAGVAYHELPLPSLMIDLDEPEDLEAFLATKLGEGVGGRRTRALLAEVLAGEDA
jgi:2-phospho-L-lactate guanylyltransferase